MLFERDLEDAYPVPLNILDLIEETIAISNLPSHMLRSSGNHNLSIHNIS